VRVSNLTFLVNSLNEILKRILMQDSRYLSLSLSEDRAEIEDVPDENDGRTVERTVRKQEGI
jgi:hypothetical protein